MLQYMVQTYCLLALDEPCSACAQVQRYSGAFLMSARKQGIGLRTPSSAVKTAGGYAGSPGWSPAAASATAVQSMLGREASGQLPSSAEDEDMGELAEDEEFAVEEHAHRWTSSHFPCFSPKQMMRNGAHLVMLLH